MLVPLQSRPLSIGLMATLAATGCSDVGRQEDDRSYSTDRTVLPSLADQISTIPSGRVALGARLFLETGLSADSTLSCATCHQLGTALAEHRSVSNGIGSKARRRNAPSLLNVGATRSAFDWDGRAGTLEAQLLGVYSIDGDMGIELEDAVRRLRGNPSYRAAFLDVYGRMPDSATLLASLGAFQRTLMVDESRFRRYYLGGEDNLLSATEVQGWRLFRDAGCAGCHPPVPDPAGSGALLFTDNKFHNLGVGFDDGRMRDVGRYEATRRLEDWGAFKTPSLQNVELTGPYMHDGSFATLEEVVAFYDSGGNRNPNLDVIIKPRGFAQGERKALVAFLRTLTTEWLRDSTVTRRRFGMELRE